MSKASESTQARLREIFDALRQRLDDTDDALVTDASVYGGASDMPCEIWSTEDEVPTSRVHEDLVLLATYEAERLARAAPGLGRRRK